VSTAYRPDPLPIDIPAEPGVRLIPLGGLLFPFASGEHVTAFRSASSSMRPGISTTIGIKKSLTT